MAFQRCERIIAQNLAASRVANGNVAHAQQESDKDFVIGCLDMISGLAEGLGPGVQPLVARSQLRSMLLQCCQVRHSRLGLGTPPPTPLACTLLWVHWCGELYVWARACSPWSRARSCTACCCSAVSWGTLGLA